MDENWNQQAPVGFYPSVSDILAALDRGYDQVRQALDVQLDVDAGGKIDRSRVLLPTYCNFINKYLKHDDAGSHNCRQAMDYLAAGRRGAGEAQARGP